MIIYSFSADNGVDPPTTSRKIGENTFALFLTEGFEAMAYQARITNFAAVNQRLNYAQMKIKR